MSRGDAHQAPGVLHLAVSLQVIDPAGNWLLQRRAASKVTFPSRWANTCCTHPAPGEDPARAAIRRVREETGLVVDHLVVAGAFNYRAYDTESGLVEYEHDHVYVAEVDTSGAVADPEEIDEFALLPFPDALRLTQSESGAPWAAEVLRRSFQAVNNPRSPARNRWGVPGPYRPQS